jgi:hypothetical protein
MPHLAHASAARLYERQIQSQQDYFTPANPAFLIMATSVGIDIVSHMTGMDQPVDLTIHRIDVVRLCTTQDYRKTGRWID